MNIKYQKEGKEIIDKINNLMPWDKKELLSYLLESMDSGEIEEFCNDNGFVNYDTIDHVKEVIDNGQEQEVLDEMNDWEIMDYLFDSYDTWRDSSNLADWIGRMQWDAVAEAISKLKDSDLSEIMKELLKEHKDTVRKILDVLVGLDN